MCQRQLMVNLLSGASRESQTKYTRELRKQDMHFSENHFIEIGGQLT